MFRSNERENRLFLNSSSGGGGGGGAVNICGIKYLEQLKYADALINRSFSKVEKPHTVIHFRSNLLVYLLVCIHAAKLYPESSNFYSHLGQLQGGSRGYPASETEIWAYCKKRMKWGKVNQYRNNNNSDNKKTVKTIEF